MKMKSYICLFVLFLCCLKLNYLWYSDEIKEMNAFLGFLLLDFSALMFTMLLTGVFLLFMAFGKEFKRQFFS